MEKKKYSKRFKIFLISVQIILLSAIAYFIYSPVFKPPVFTGKEKSIAVLPFIYAGADTTQTYIADEITEDIISKLYKAADLKVTARNSVVRYKSNKRDMLKIARELHVASVLDGSVERSGDQLKINARLIDAGNGKIIMTRVYHRELKDLFNIQAELVESITEGLNAGLTDDEKTVISKRPTQNLEAFNFYSQGRYFYYKRNDSAMRKGIELYKKAIALDSNYSRAWSGLADCYAALGYASFESPAAAFLKSEEAAHKALQLDSTLAEPHTSLGYIQFYYYWNWTAAETEFRKAISLNPQYDMAYDAYGYYLTAMERFPESRSVFGKAVQLSPLSSLINTDVGFNLFYNKNYDQAMSSLGSALALNPKNALAHIWLGRCFQEKKLYPQSIDEYQRALSILPDWPVTLAAIAYVYGALGKKDEAEKILVKLKSLSASRYVTPYGIALVYASMNEMDPCFEWLGKAYADRANWLVWLKQDPRWDPIRNDKRYQELVSKIELPNNVEINAAQLK